MPRQMGGVNRTTYRYQRGACGYPGGVDWVQTGLTIGIPEGRPVMRAFCDHPQGGWWTEWRTGNLAEGWSDQHAQTGNWAIGQAAYAQGCLLTLLTLPITMLLNKCTHRKAVRNHHPATPVD